MDWYELLLLLRVMSRFIWLSEAVGCQSSHEQRNNIIIKHIIWLARGPSKIMKLYADGMLVLEQLAGPMRSWLAPQAVGWPHMQLAGPACSWLVQVAVGPACVGCL